MIVENRFGGKKDVKRVVPGSMKERVLQEELNLISSSRIHGDLLCTR
jgi:hypothetical protein